MSISFTVSLGFFLCLFFSFLNLTFSSLFDYVVWSRCTKSEASRLETLHNYACCTVLRKHKGSSTLAAHRELGLNFTSTLPCSIHSFMSSKSPPYLSHLFSSPSSHYNTRSASSFQLNLPPNQSSFGQRSLSFMGAALWRSLSQNIQDNRDFTRYYSLCQRH